MKFSLIVATKNRIKELDALFISLKNQEYKNFEVILVDQNKDDRLNEIVNEYSMFFYLRHLKSKPGLSKARNFALQYATGDVVCFPDDDCWYTPKTLIKVRKSFEHNQEVLMVSSSVKDENNVTFIPVGVKGGVVCFTKNNVWKIAFSSSIFTLRKVNLFFDEMLGVGSSSVFQAGEETDYILRVMKMGKVIYSPQIEIYHPNKDKEYDCQRALTYGAGISKVYSRYYSVFYCCVFVFKPIFKMLISVFSPKKFKYYLHSFAGRLFGILIK